MILEEPPSRISKVPSPSRSQSYWTIEPPGSVEPRGVERDVVAEVDGERVRDRRATAVGGLPRELDRVLDQVAVERHRAAAATVVEEVEAREVEVGGLVDLLEVAARGGRVEQRAVAHRIRDPRRRATRAEALPPSA